MALSEGQSLLRKLEKVGCPFANNILIGTKEMPRILKTLDQIAREKQRAVLFVSFYKHGTSILELLDSDWDYEQCHERIVFIQWLEKNNINFEECFRSSSMPYFGEIYLDVPYDELNPQYQLLSQYLENPDGSLKDPDVAWYFMPLDMAMKYKHHDDPENWEW